MVSPRKVEQFASAILMATWIVDTLDVQIHEVVTDGTTWSVIYTDIHQPARATVYQDRVTTEAKQQGGPSEV